MIRTPYSQAIRGIESGNRCSVASYLAPFYRSVCARCDATTENVKQLAAQHHTPDSQLAWFVLWAVRRSPRVADVPPGLRDAVEAAADALVLKWGLEFWLFDGAGSAGRGFLE